MRQFITRHGAHIVGWVLTLSLIGGLGVAQALPGRDTVYSDDIVNGQVRSADIANGGVRSLDIADGTVRSADIANGGVRSPDIADGAVQTRDLAANSIGAAKIKDGSIGSADVANDALTGTDIEDGSIGSADVADDALTGSDIEDGSIGSADIATGAIASDEVLDGSIGSADIATGAIASDEVLDGSIGSADLDTVVSESLLGGRIPSGATVTGAAVLQAAATVPSNFQIGVNLPGDAGTTLTDTDVNFAEDVNVQTLDDDPACAGHYDAPTAPSGKVCLYLESTDSDAFNIQGKVPLPGAARTSFVVKWYDDSNDNDTVFLRATWAYTAP